MLLGLSLKLYPLYASAADIIGNGAKDACPVDAAGKSDCGIADIHGLFSSVTGILLFIIGAISVVMIIIGGLRYVLSAGDPKATASAKDTILYAIVGLVVAFAAYAIITFVTSHVGTPVASPTPKVK